MKFWITFTVLLASAASSPRLVAGPLSGTNPFESCGSEQPLPDPPLADPAHNAPGEAVISADEAQAIDEGISILRGNVELRRDDQALRADTVTWDKARDIVNINGHVNFWDQGLFWSGEKGYVYLGDDKAYLENGDYHLIGRRGNGYVGYATTDRSQRESYLERVDFTTCEKPDPSWLLSASSMRLHHDDQRGEASNVVLRFLDVPIFYWPYLTFPLNNQRKTGFLMPLLGYRSRTGADVTIPFYWNIAPNQDATFSVRGLSERGVMFGAQYRYLLETGLGEFDVHYLPEDMRFRDLSRHLISFKHDQSFLNGRMHANMVFNDVSDKNYFVDFGTSLTSTSTRLLERRADLTYGGTYLQKNTWNILARVQSYQAVDPAIQSVSLAYDRLPQVYFSTLMPDLYRNLYLQMDAEATYFDRSVGPTGSRFDVRSSLGFPFRGRAGFIEPKVTLRHTSYILDTSRLASPVDVRTDTPSRTLPTVSFDSGLFFERKTLFGQNSYVQTLEPRAYYLYIPYHNQVDLPLFDTGLYDVSFAGLFRENRFNGPDRIGDANQFTLALTSRLISDNTGWERFRISVGQTFYFQDRQVALRSRLQPPPGARVLSTLNPEDPLSETLAEVSAKFSREWTGRANMTWNPNNGRSRKATVGVRYWADDGTILNLEYRRRTDILGIGLAPIEQADISARLPVNRHFAVLGRWLYSLRDDNTVEAMGGLEYDSCCWSLRFLARHYVITSAQLAGTAAVPASLTQGPMDTGFFLQLEFKGLAGLGKNTLNFLRNSIPGYRDYW